MCQHGTTRLVRVFVDSSLSHTGSGHWAHKPIDSCIADLVEALQNAGINMLGSCCGHGKRSGEIALADGRVIRVYVAGDDDGASPPCGELA